MPDSSVITSLPILIFKLKWSYQLILTGQLLKLWSERSLLYSLQFIQIKPTLKIQDLNECLIHHSCYTSNVVQTLQSLSYTRLDNYCQLTPHTSLDVVYTFPHQFSAVLPLFYLHSFTFKRSNSLACLKASIMTLWAFVYLSLSLVLLE